MPLPFSSPRFLYRVNSQGVVFIALSWLVLVTMWSCCCVCKSTPCHTPAYSHLWQNAQRKETGGVKLKNGQREGEREKKREMIFSCSFFLLCCSLITWLFNDWITTAVPGDTFHSHTFHIPEMHWQTHTCRHQSAVSLTAAAPPTLETKMVRKVDRNLRVGEMRDHESVF